MKLTDWLKSSGMTQCEFANLLGVHESHVSRFMRGERRPSPDLALRIEVVTSGAVSRMALLYPEPVECEGVAA